MIGFMPDVQPSTNIRHNYNLFSKHCREVNAPVLITKNGKADMVVMSVESYQRMMAQYRLGQMLAKVDSDIEAGVPMRDFEDVFSDIEERLENA